MSFGAGWYAVAIGQGLEPGTSAGTRLFGDELVVWRDKDGASHIWEDRCPHRGMRLSFGFVRGNHIACLYHGWQYDEAGQCRHIPAHPKLEVPETIKVATYPSAEASGMIWVYSERVDEAPIPPPEAIDSVPVRSLYVDRAPETVGFILENGGAWPFEILSPSLFATEVEGASVLIALQPFTEDRTALHIAITDGEIAPAEIAIWAEELRAVLETIRPVSSGDAALAERFA